MPNNPLKLILSFLLDELKNGTLASLRNVAKYKNMARIISSVHPKACKKPRKMTINPIMNPL
jgi:hypothetical protein